MITEHTLKVQVVWNARIEDAGPRRYEVVL